MVKKGLGKGLGALIPGFGEAKDQEVHEIPISDIVESPFQPRKKIDEEKIKELAASIKEHGIIQPVIVRRNGAKYELIAGERRYRAAVLAGLKSIPALIKNVTNDESLMLALIENLQRENLNPVEEAEGYRTLIESFGLTQEEAAQKVGKSRTAVTNALRILKLPTTIKEMIVKGDLSAGHARALLSVKSKEKQIELANLITKKGLSVREAELLSREFNVREKRQRKVTEIPPRASGVLERLSSLLGKKIKIRMTKRSVKVEIAFRNIEEIEAFVERISK